jgi:hypothetical protein
VLLVFGLDLSTGPFGQLGPSEVGQTREFVDASTTDVANSILASLLVFRAKMPGFSSDTGNTGEGRLRKPP